MELVATHTLLLPVFVLSHGNTAVTAFRPVTVNFDTCAPAYQTSPCAE